MSGVFCVTDMRVEEIEVTVTGNVCVTVTQNLYFIPGKRMTYTD